jgi:hypothetical protein
MIDNLLVRNDNPKPKLSDVDKFDGSLNMWEVWYPEIQAKLRIDEKALGKSEKIKFWYIYFRLNKKIQALVVLQLGAAKKAKSYDHQDLLD